MPTFTTHRLQELQELQTINWNGHYKTTHNWT